MSNARHVRCRRRGIVTGLVATACLALAGTALAASPAAEATYREALVPGTPCTVTAQACVDLDSQRAWLFENGTVIRGPVPVATGGNGQATPVGHSLRVYRKDADHVIPGSLNSERLPWMWQVDVALTQNLELFDHEVGLLVEVRNLTNNQNAHTVYTATGEADDDGWLDTPEGQAAVEQNGDEFERAYLDRIEDPTHYRDGIQGRLGLSVHF